MNNKRNSSSSSGIGILGVLQIVFLVLKLTGLITWSWTVVLIPLWISLVMLVIFLIVTIIVVKNNFKTKRYKFGFMSINTLKIEDRNLKRKQPSNKGANDYIFVAK